MTQFNPCKDRNACTEDGNVCRGCGRTHVEIARTRALVNELVRFVSVMNYDNTEEFMAYLSRKVLKKTKLAEHLSNTVN
jgi:predicted Fe-S protein YdhL (DUF1289 family)